MKKRGATAGGLSTPPRVSSDCTPESSTGDTGAAETMAQVEVRGISKHFGEVRAVDRVDIATAEGEFLVLLGPSGCGKTTLLRMIAGIETPTSGDILIGGQVVNDLPPRARKIAMVFQSYALYPQMTVFRNIAFPIKSQGFPREEIPTKMEGDVPEYRHVRIE